MFLHRTKSFRFVDIENYFYSTFNFVCILSTWTQCGALGFASVSWCRACVCVLDVFVWQGPRHIKISPLRYGKVFVRSAPYMYGDSMHDPLRQL